MSNKTVFEALYQTPQIARSKISSTRRSVSSPLRLNTEKGVENTTRSGIFLTNFEVFPLVMKRCVEWVTLFLNQMILEGEIKDVKWAVFHLISKHSLNIVFLCIFLWIIDEFENELWKTVTLASFQKPQFQSVLIFFTVCLSLPSFFQSLNFDKFRDIAPLKVQQSKEQK